MYIFARCLQTYLKLNLHVVDGNAGPVLENKQFVPTKAEVTYSERNICGRSRLTEGRHHRIFDLCPESVSSVQFSYLAAIFKRQTISKKFQCKKCSF